MSKIILVVEDNQMNMELIKDLLEANGYHVIPAATAGSAVDALKEVTPHLIITDIQLPDLDGCSLIELLKNNEKTAKVPIIALTALAMTGDKNKILKCGSDEYISKPINTKDFLKTVSRFFGEE